MGLYKGGSYTGGLIHGRSFVLVINKSDINISVINREINVLSSDYWANINWGTYIRVGLYSGGGAYIWNEVSVSTCGGLIHGLIFGGGGGAYSRRFTVCKIFTYAKHLPMQNSYCDHRNLIV